MILLKRVLVATDFSPGADAALTYGRALAHRFDATLHVMHIVENDFFVLGTHGRGAVAHLLIGSVAERVVRTAPCPVLTVRRPEHEFILPDALVTVKQA